MTPAGWDRLRPYQRSAAEALASRSRTGLWMAPGLGKTAIALAARSLASPDALTLVVTRAIGRHAWARDAEWVLGEPAANLWAGKARSKSGRHRDGTFSDLAKAREHARIIVTNYEVLKARYAELSAVPWEILVLDEAHEIKQGYLSPKRYESGKWKWRRFEYSRALARAVQARGGHVWELTATPVRDRVRDLWAQLHVVLPHETKAFYPPWGSDEALWPETSWAGRYCGLRRGDWGLESTGATHLDELGEYISSRFVVVRRETVAAELPSIQRDVRVVEPDWSLASVVGGGIEGAVQRAAETKLPAGIEIALEYLSGSERVVLVTSRRKHVGMIAEALRARASKELQRSVREKLRVESVTGETDVRARVEICRGLQEYAGPVALVATADSITTSMDLHRFSGLVFLALPYTPFGIEQMEGRVGRLGGVCCTVHYLVAEESIDEKIRETLLDKLAAVRMVGANTQQSVEGTLRELKPAEEIMEELTAWLETKEGR